MDYTGNDISCRPYELAKLVCPAESASASLELTFLYAENESPRRWTADTEDGRVVFYGVDAYVRETMERQGTPAAVFRLVYTEHGEPERTNRLRVIAGDERDFLPFENRELEWFLTTAIVRLTYPGAKETLCFVDFRKEDHVLERTALVDTATGLAQVRLDDVILPLGEQGWHHYIAMEVDGWFTEALEKDYTALALRCVSLRLVNKDRAELKPRTMLYFVAQHPRNLVSFRFRNVFGAWEYIHLQAAQKGAREVSREIARIGGRRVPYDRKVEDVLEIQAEALDVWTEARARELVAAREVVLCRNDGTEEPVVLTEAVVRTPTGGSPGTLKMTCQTVSGNHPVPRRPKDPNALSNQWMEI